jgi:hypothetical protein
MTRATPRKARPVPTDEELAQQGMAIFRGIVARGRLGLCAKRIARDRFCPRPATTERGLFCEWHRRQADEDDRRIETMEWEAERRASSPNSGHGSGLA